MGFFGVVGELGGGAYDVEGWGGFGGGDGALDGSGGAVVGGVGGGPGGGEGDGGGGGGVLVAVGDGVVVPSPQSKV